MFAARNTNQTVKRIVNGAAICAIGIACVSGVLALSARAWLHANSLNKPSSERIGTSFTHPMSQRNRSNIESEVITITPHGFEPQAINRPQGRFLLMIDNRSGLTTNTPQLTREVGGRLLDLIVRREEPNWSDVIELQPGRYILSEAGHPNWICLITITAQ